MGLEPDEQRSDHAGPFLVLLRDQVPGSGNDLPGIFYNKNAGDITKWTYDPDFNRPANNSSSGSITPTLRLTAQLNRSMQVGVFVDARSVQTQ